MFSIKNPSVFVLTIFSLHLQEGQQVVYLIARSSIFAPFSLDSLAQILQKIECEVSGFFCSIIGSNLVLFNFCYFSIAFNLESSLVLDESVEKVVVKIFLFIVRALKFFFRKASYAQPLPNIINNQKGHLLLLGFFSRKYFNIS